MTVLGEWIKGHFNGKDKAFKHNMNGLADSLGTEHMVDQPTHFKAVHCPVTNPTYKLCLKVHNLVVTSKLYTTLSTAVHEPKIIQLSFVKQNVPGRNPYNKLGLFQMGLPASVSI